MGILKTARAYQGRKIAEAMAQAAGPPETWPLWLVFIGGTDAEHYRAVFRAPKASRAEVMAWRLFDLDRLRDSVYVQQVD